MAIIAISIAFASVIIAAFTAVMSFWSAKEARNSAKATQDTAEASLVVLFLEKYFDPGMAEALRVLAAWKRDNDKDFANIWIEGMNSGSAEAWAAEDARRKVKGYFDEIARLRFIGVIRTETLREIAYVAGLNIYFDVIDPMELALYPSRSPRIIEFLMTQFGRYPETEKIKPVPPRLPASA
jgi:hypothetical protein